ncbi:MAG: zinc-dependent peptidase, partial [Burkholderiales bacterium]
MGWLADWKRRRVLARHRIDDALWDSVAGALRFLAPLSAQERRQLRELALLFIAEKHFTATHGFELKDAMRLSIAAQACLPVLELGLDRYAGWREIVVYPGDFRVRIAETDADGVTHEFEDERAGESWPGGPVVLSWDATANDPEINVVIHEFAHMLDMASGEADGRPPLHAGMDQRAWNESFRVAYEGFC